MANNHHHNHYLVITPIQCFCYQYCLLPLHVSEVAEQDIV